MRKFILAVTMTIPLLATGTLAAAAAPIPSQNKACELDPSTGGCANNNGEMDGGFRGTRHFPTTRAASTLSDRVAASTRSDRAGGNRESGHSAGHGGGGRR